MTKILKFSEAVTASSSLGDRHLLLGNGFSISCFPNIFDYKSLYDAAVFPSDSRLRNIFAALDTTDFEYVMRRLDETKDIVSIYSPGNSASHILEPLEREKESLRNTLVETIVNNHPDSPDKIEDEQYRRCRAFLKGFLDNGAGSVFTLNYDLLLYWTLMRPPGGPMGSDGFSKRNGRLLWTGPRDEQTVHYLHGALHLFETGDEVAKLTSVNMGRKILDQVTSSIRSNRFPLFVTEGKSQQKRRKIRRNPYLKNSYRRFRDALRNEDSVLFVFGHSLSDQDDHIRKQIVKGSFRHLYVSVRREDEPKIVPTVQKLAQQRPSLTVHYYAAESAYVWRAES